MKISDIESKYGLPCLVKNKKVTRTILRKCDIRSDWYIQYNPDRPQDGEYVLCDTSNNWEYLGKSSKY